MDKPITRKLLLALGAEKKLIEKQGRKFKEYFVLKVGPQTEIALRSSKTDTGEEQWVIARPSQIVNSMSVAGHFFQNTLEPCPDVMHLFNYVLRMGINHGEEKLKSSFRNLMGVAFDGR